MAKRKPNYDKLAQFFALLSELNKFSYMEISEAVGKSRQATRKAALKYEVKLVKKSKE